MGEWQGLASRRPKDEIHLQWKGGELVGPAGEACPPVSLGQSDARFAHEMVDKWMRENAGLRQFPSASSWSFEWTVRAVLFSELYDALGPARALRQMREELGRCPARVVVHQPPASWWGPLVEGVFPETRVIVEGGNRRDLLKKGLWYGVRGLQAVASAARFRRLPAPDPKRPRVLVLSRDRAWSGTEDRGLESVMRALERGGLDVVVLAVAGCGGRHRLSCLRTRPNTHLFGEQVLFRHILRHGVPKAPDISRAGGSYVVDDVDMAPFVKHIYEKGMAPHWIQQRVYAESAPEFIREIGACVAVMSDENGGGVAWKQALLAAGLPIIAVQHGAISEDLLYYAYPKGTDPQAVPLCPVTCVYGPRVREILVEDSTYPESSVVVTGQPEMDLRPMAERGWVQKRGPHGRLRAETLPECCDRLLLFVSQHPHRMVYGPRLLRAFSGSNPRNFLVIRPHPLETAEPFWKESIRRFGLEGRVSVRGGGELGEWLDACDVLIGCSSTVLSEAAAMARPVITIGARELGDGTRCVEHGVAVDLSDFGSLDEVIEYWLGAAPGCLAERERRRLSFIEQEFYRVDGRAGERVARVVERTIAGDYATNGQCDF